MSRLLPKDASTPVLWYLAITVGVPLLGGAASPAFFRHAAAVVAVTAAMLGVRLAVGWLAIPAARLSRRGPESRGCRLLPSRVACRFRPPANGTPAAPAGAAAVPGIQTETS